MKSFHKLVSSPLIAIITSSTNSLRGNHNQLADIKLCLHKAYVTFENIRKTNRKSSLLSSPCLDGTPAFPNSRSPTEHVMPRAARRGKGLLGMCLHYLCSPCGYRTRTVLLGALSHFGRTGGAGSDLPGPWLARCDRWWYSGWEILLQAAGVSSFILRMLLLTS